MKAEKALKTIKWISLAGLLFSGYLSYFELFGGKCALGGCSFVLGVPACVYGFVMYAIVLMVAHAGLKNR